VLGIGCDALGAVDDVAVVDTGAVGGAVGSNAAVVRFLLHVAQAEFRFTRQAEQGVVENQPGLDAVAVEGAVVAGERVGVYPATGGVGRGGVDIVAPVVAGHFAPVHQGLEGSVVAEGPLVVQVEALAVGEEPVVRGWIVVPLGAVIVQQQAAVGDIGVVLMPGKLQAHGVGIVEAHAGLGHDVGHFVALVHEAVALAVGGD